MDFTLGAYGLEERIVQNLAVDRDRHARSYGFGDSGKSLLEHAQKFTNVTDREREFLSLAREFS